MKNKKGGNCCWCGEYIAPGEGNLRYVDEEDENLGFGPMGRTGWIVSCLDREACMIRKAKNRELEIARNIRKRNILATEQRLFQDGKYILEDKPFMVFGTIYERPGKGFNIYGGGVQYIVTADYIWHIKNNGMDGDDWSRNNIRTGGAGAIGTRFEKTEARIAFLEAHTENITEKRKKEKADEEKTEKERNEKIKAGLEAMLSRTPGGWDTLAKAMEKAKVKTFCPKELLIAGTKRGMVNLTIKEAKRYLEKKEA